MYQIISGSVKLKDSYTGWSNKDISNIPLRELFSTYSGIYVILSNPYITGDVAFNVYNLVNTHADSTMSLSQFLVNNGALTLQTEPKENGVFNKKFVKYVDVFKSGYTVGNTAPNTPPGTNHAAQDKTWLTLNKEGVRSETIFNYCLANVNGFFHMMDYDQHAVYVIDGMRSNFISNTNLIGLLSFADIGTIKCVPIKPDMVYKQNPSQGYKDSLCIDIGESVAGKSLALVLGGYLHLVDTTLFKMIDDDRCVINFSNYPFMERYYESGNYIDLSGMALETTENNPSQRGVENFYSDDNILSYLTLSQSFFVIIDAQDLTLTKKYLRRQLMPEQYISDIDPILPMVVGGGKLANYWSVKHHGQWSVTCVDSVKHNRVFKETRMTGQIGFTDSRVPSKPQQRSEAYFLEIAKEV